MQRVKVSPAAVLPWISAPNSHAGLRLSAKSQLDVASTIVQNQHLVLAHAECCEPCGYSYANAWPAASSMLSTMPQQASPGQPKASSDSICALLSCWFSTEGRDTVVNKAIFYCARVL